MYAFSRFEHYLFANSGSLVSADTLKNNFDKEKLQSEIDLQVKVTQEFRSNVQDFRNKQNQRKEELKAKLERNEISQEDYEQQSKRIDMQNLALNMVVSGLMSPSDSVLGVATSTVSPAVSYAIGQHFKEQGKEGSFEHIATHAVLGVLTSAANGGNAFAGAVSAGGGEYIAKVTAETLFGKSNSQDLTVEEKQTVSTVAQLVGVLSGSVVGDSSVNAYIGGTVASNAVVNNYLFPPENAQYDKAKKRADELRHSKTPLNDEERKELAELDAKIDYYEDLSERRNKEFDIAYDNCRYKADCDKFYYLHVIQRKEWTDKGVEQFKQDLKNGKLSENWVLEKDSKNMFHNFSDDGTEIMKNPDGTYVNAKYTHKNGQYEVIVNKLTGEIVMHPNNAGTFNYYGNSDKYPGGSAVGHIDYDVDPWTDFGNGLGDRTTYLGRKRNGVYAADTTWEKTKQLFIGDILFGEFGNVTTNQIEQRKKAINEFNKLDQKSLK